MDEFEQIIIGDAVKTLEALGDDPVIDSTGKLMLGRVGKSAYLILVNDTEKSFNDMTEDELDQMSDRALED